MFKENNKREKELAGCQITYITVIDLLTPDSAVEKCIEFFIISDEADLKT